MADPIANFANSQPKSNRQSNGQSNGQSNDRASRAVIDQPGLKIIVAGLLLSIFLGLGFHSQITSNKVSNLVKKSLDKVSPDLQIDFERAEVKLSDWGIPKPYIIVNQVRIKNSALECSQNQIYIDKLVVPLTFNLIFEPAKVIDSLRLNRVEVRLGSTSLCKMIGLPIHQSTSATTGAAASAPLQPIGSLPSIAVPANRLREKSNAVFQSTILKWRTDLSARLNEVRIDLIKIIQEDDYNKNFEFRNASIQFDYKNKQLEKLTAQAQLVGLYDQHSSSFKLRSEVQSEIIFSESKFIGQLSLKGKIIDRDFSAMTQLDSDVGLVKITSNIRNIPVKTLVDIFKAGTTDGPRAAKDTADKSTFQLTTDHTMNFNLSGEYVADFNIFEKKWQTMQLSNAVIKSADSSIELNYFDYLKWLTDEKYKIQLVIVQLNMDHLYGLFGRTESSATFESLGQFSGTFEIAKNFESNLTGILRNTTLIFSNQNRRKLERITSMNIKSSIAKNLFQLKLSDISIENQKISGQIDAKLPFTLVDHKLDIEPKNLQIAVLLKGKLLSTEIEQHMFGHEQGGDIVFKFNSSSSIRQVVVSSDELNYENLDIKKLNFTTELDIHYKPYLYRLSAKTVQFNDPESVENGTQENFYLEFMRSYFQENNATWPVSVQNLDVKYYFGKNLSGAEGPVFDNYQLNVTSFLVPKNFTQFRQTGKMSATSVWQIENSLKTVDAPAVTSHFILDPSRSSFEKTQ